MEHPTNRFAVWLRENRYTDPQFAAAMAKALETPRFSSRTVEKWRIGKSIPRPRNMGAIKAITKGEITADSFLEEPHAAND